MNERKTEDLVERRLRDRDYFAPDSGITVEKQRSDNGRVQKLLENASKQGHGVGRPEFLIRSTARPNLIIVIECKASPQRHESPTRDRYADFAVDGVLLYASFLSKEFDVIAIAVSGESDITLRLSHFLHLKGTDEAVDWPDPQSILSFEDYHHAYVQSDAKFRQDYAALVEFSRGLNHELQARKVTEADRGFLVSGILIALNDAAFKQTYSLHRTSKNLATTLLQTIRAEFETAQLPQERREELVQAFSFISHSPALMRDRDFFVSLIQRIDENVNTFMRTHEYYDTIGQFYVEFLRYANNDKGLGIVLTPHHIAELFAELAEVNKDSIVYDNCCGTSGLLIAAMSAMIQDAGPDRALHKRIKERQLFGIEFQPKVYALAVSNMILHGDGKTNILRGDCFYDAPKLFPHTKPTVGILNPPYRNKTVKEDREELEFVLNNLDQLAMGGRCVAILPITCATAPNGIIADWKERLMKRHTLEAVMSMPIELFHNSKTTVVTCVMVWTAHRPHPAGKKTWFGYWRDDGFIKTKHRGRFDGRGTWASVKTAWANAFRNRDVIPGLSVAREVTWSDEWCAEAYLPTNYERIDQAALSHAIQRFLIARVMPEPSDPVVQAGEAVS